MPFYEYQCKSCGHELEAMQKVSDAPLKKCPHCGKSQLQRLMSAPVFRLRGSGWYETDFKDDKDKKRNLADKPDADAKGETELKAETKADAKAEAKADQKGDAASASADSDKATGKPAEKEADKAVDKSSSAAKPKRAGRKATKRSKKKR
jgi:putative FmdB family regulatory protein